MSDELIVEDRPQLERPVMIAAFRGWNDGGQGASLAAAYLARAWAAEPFAHIEAELWISLLELRQEARQNIGRDGWNDAQTQASDKRLRVMPGDVDEIIDRGEDGVGARGNGGSHLCQHHVGRNRDI